MKATPIPQFGEWTDDASTFTNVFEKKKAEKLSVAGGVGGADHPSGPASARSSGSWGVDQRQANLGKHSFDPSSGARQSGSPPPPHGGPMSPVIPKFGEWLQSSGSYTAEFEANLKEAKARSKLSAVLDNPEMRKLLTDDEIDWLRGLDNAPGQKLSTLSREGSMPVPESKEDSDGSETARTSQLLENDTKVSSAAVSQSSTPRDGRSLAGVPAGGTWSSSSSPIHTAASKKHEGQAVARASSATFEDGGSKATKDAAIELGGRMSQGRDVQTCDEEMRAASEVDGEKLQMKGAAQENNSNLSAEELDTSPAGRSGSLAKLPRGFSMVSKVDDARTPSATASGEAEHQDGGVPHFGDWGTNTESESYTAKFQQKRAVRASGGSSKAGTTGSLADAKGSQDENEHVGESSRSPEEQSDDSDTEEDVQREGEGRTMEEGANIGRKEKGNKEEEEQVVQGRQESRVKLGVVGGEQKIGADQKPLVHVAPMGNWSTKERYTTMFEEARKDRRERGSVGKEPPVGPKRASTTARSSKETSQKGKRRPKEAEEATKQPACCVIL